MVHLFPHLAVAVNFETQPLREEVDNADTDAVEAAGHLVGITVEFPSCVEFGHDDLGRRAPALFVRVYRYAAAVVGDGDGLIGVDRDTDLTTVSRLRFVNRVVHDLPHHMMQTGDVVNVADVHPGAFADRFQTLEDLDVLRVVGVTH